MVFPGTAELVSSFAGGGQLEDAAYARQAKRIMDVQNSQAQLNKRVQEAYDLSRQNKSRDQFPNTYAAAITNMDPGQTTFGPNQMAALIPAMASVNGWDFSDAAGGLDKNMESLLRMAMANATREASFTPVNQAALAFDPKPVPTLERDGDVFLRDNLTADPSVDQLVSGMNAAFGATSDKSGVGAKDQREIASLKRQINPTTGQNFTQSEAENIVYDIRKMGINSVSGEPFVMDAVGESVNYIEPGGGTTGLPLPSVPDDETYFEQANKGTGPKNKFDALWAQVASLIPGTNPDFESTEAITNMTANLQTMIRSLSINDKNAVSEQERLLEWINVQPGWFKSPQLIQSRVRGLDNALRQRMRKALFDMGDDSLAPALKRDAQNDVKMIRQTLDMIGTPEHRASKKYPGFWELPKEQQQRLIDLESRVPQGN